MKILLLIALIFAGISSGMADDKPVPSGFAVANIVLYQPNDVLQERMPDAAVLVVYIKKLEAVLAEELVKNTTPETLDTVIALRPDGRVGVWFVSSTRAGTGAELDSLRKKLAAITPVEVKAGPVAFAIVGKVAGGDSTKTETGPGYTLPIPAEWKEANKDRKGEASFEEFLQTAWP